ncbi:MAG: hypothetical protein PHS59_16370 [Paludibacter sp.]|nr:hypothetical protein [Paludibacter sp.]
MQAIEKTTDGIDKIFKIINVVYDQTILSFDPIETVIAHFKEAFNLSNNINFSDLNQELLSEENDKIDFDEILYTIESEFDQIINWKQINTFFGIGV